MVDLKPYAIAIAREWQQGLTSVKITLKSLPEVFRVATALEMEGDLKCHVLWNTDYHSSELWPC